MALELDVKTATKTVTEMPFADTVPLESKHKTEAESSKEDSPPLEPVSYWKLYSTADKTDKLLIAAGLVGAAGGGVMLPLFSVVFGQFINAFGNPYGSDLMSTTRTLALKFVWLAIGGFVAMYLEVTAFVLAGERQTNRLRAQYLDAVLRQDIAFFDTTATTGGLLQGLNEDSLAVQAAISEKASNFVHHACTFVTGFIIAFTYGWSMTLVMIGMLPLMAVMGSLIGWVATARARADAEAYKDASTVAQQAISSVRTLMAYNGQEATLQTYSQELSKPVVAGVKSGILTALGLGGLQFMMYISYAIGLIFGAFQIIKGNYDGGTVVLVNIATLMSSFALGQAAPSLAAFGKGRIAGAKMFHIIERQPEMKDVGDVPTTVGNVQHATDESSPSSSAAPASGLFHMQADNKVAAENGKEGHAANDTRSSGEASTPHATDTAHDLLPFKGSKKEFTATSVQGRLDLVKVYFAYPARPDVQVFKGFSLEVPAGQTVALVGASGSGKSTAIQLIERFYDPQSGQVLLDGTDLRSLKLAFLRSHVGLVSQEPTLFATTIYENIALGREGATEEEVLEAAVAANAHKFIRVLPEGYYTQVGERGVQLSGGQKQRIAIARAILKNPKVLLLDEATSALDTQSERIVQAALDRMVVGRTTVVVAHRLSTIKHAHRICVVSNGVVGETGTHDELLTRSDGLYSALVRMQVQLAEQGEQQVVREEVGVEEVDDDEDPIVTKENLQQVLAGARTGSGQLSMNGAAPVRPSTEAASRISLSRDASGAVSGGQVAAAAAQPRGPSRLSLQGAAGSAAIPVVSTTDNSHGGLGRVSKDSVNTAGSKPLKEVTVVLDKADGTEKKKISEKEQEKLDEERAKEVPLSRLIMMNKPEWMYLGLGVVGSIGAGLQHPALAFVFSDMVSVFFLSDMSELRRRAIFYCLMFVVIAFGALAAVMLQQACLAYAGSQLARRVRVQLLSAILRQEVAFFDDDQHSSGRLTSTLATDATYIRGAVADASAVAMQNLSTLAIGYLIAFGYNWQMALVITGTFPILIGAMILQMRFVMGTSSTSDSLYAGASQYIMEAFASIRTIHAYNLQSYITNKYAAMLLSTRPIVNKQAHMGGLGMGFSFSMMFALYALIVWFGGWQLAHGQTDFEGFLKGFMAILLAAIGMAQAGIAFPDLGRAKGAVGRVFPILDRQPAITVDDPNGAKPDGNSIKGAVTFKNIKFAYPSRPTVIIYTDFNLDIPAGRVYAMVGESGSGKSTVVSLLERFYDPLEGHVYLDGKDIKDYNLKCLRNHLGLVSQEPILFAGSIADNIRYGIHREVAPEEVDSAARVANALEFIDKLPEGMNTRVGEGGIQLSGGQKQRIAIARAVLKDPKVLLLDEATSALDTRSERLVQDALDIVMVGRTCLVIAHRLSTIKNANCICVLYRGTVLEQGTHNELMAIPEGAYSKLVAAQERAHGQ